MTKKKSFIILILGGVLGHDVGIHQGAAPEQAEAAWAKHSKEFYGCNLLMFIIIQSVCPFPGACTIKHLQP